MVKKSVALCGAGLMALSIGGAAVAAPVTWSSNGHAYDVVFSGPVSWDSARTAAIAVASCAAW